MDSGWDLESACINFLITAYLFTSTDCGLSKWGYRRMACCLLFLNQPSE